MSHPQPPPFGAGLDLSKLFGTIGGLIANGSTPRPFGVTGSPGSAQAQGGSIAGSSPLAAPRPGAPSFFNPGICVDLCSQDRLIRPMEKLVLSMERLEQYMAGLYAAMVALLIIVVILIVLGIIGLGFYLYKSKVRGQKVATSSSGTKGQTIGLKEDQGYPQ